MKESAREKIIAAGVEIVAVSGFNATGIDAILKAAGVPKGSFYHHFGTKENFGIEVINLFAENYTKKLHGYLDDETLPPLQRIRRYLEESIERTVQDNFSKGCLIGNLGQELAAQSERFRCRLEEVFHDWLGLFAKCLHEAQNVDELNPGLDPQLLAGFLLSGWEGAILRTKVVRSPEPLKQFVNVLFTRVLTAG